MITFGALPTLIFGIIGCAFYALLLGMVFLFILGFSRKRPYNFLRSTGLLIGSFVIYFILQCVLAVNDNKITSQWVSGLVESFSNLPALIVCAVCGMLIVLEAYLFYLCIRWDKTHITSVSIKEAVDTIPAGVCAYEKCGRIVLKNATMDRVSMALTGEILLSGLLFEKAMNDYPNKDMMGEKEVYILPDETVCIFSKESHSISGHMLTLLTAYDMTEEYNKTQILLQKGKAVQELNSRLVEYSRDIVSIITSQEILNAKIKIHDELGAGLLAMKHYIVNGGNAEEKEGIIKKLNDNLKFLQSELVENKQDEYILIFSTANALDVRIIVDGELPSEEPNKHITATAIHECFTNTLRHADGDMLNIKVLDETSEDMIRVILTNNGEKPIAPIVEGGGLSSLRSLVEANGGTMNIEIENGFELSIYLPRKV